MPFVAALKARPGAPSSRTRRSLKAGRRRASRPKASPSRRRAKARHALERWDERHLVPLRASGLAGGLDGVGGRRLRPTSWLGCLASFVKAARALRVLGPAPLGG